MLDGCMKRGERKEGRGRFGANGKIVWRDGSRKWMKSGCLFAQQQERKGNGWMNEV